MFTSSFESFPSRSSSLSPQQYRFESVPPMQLWSVPVANWLTRTPEGSVAYPGASYAEEDPRPSWPAALRPQHASVPSSPVAHACAEPASTAPASKPAGSSTSTA